MDHLWTPWRFDYISGKAKSRECVFCKLPAEDQEQDRRNLILARFAHCFLILNRFPYTSGHLMVVLHRHVAFLEDAAAAELHEIMEIARRCEAALRAVYSPDGFNIGLNIGRSAGAGIAGHLHLHVLPRWHGDANFVSAIGETRVIPEDLQTTYSRLAPHFSNR